MELVEGTSQEQDISVLLDVTEITETKKKRLKVEC